MVEQEAERERKGRQGSLRKEVVMNVEFAKQRNVTPQWMQTGQRQIVVPAWYKWYYTVGARKLLHHAARTVRAYNTVVTHRQ